MEQLTKAILRVHWSASPTPTDISLQFNPKELSFDKSVQVAEVAIPGIDSPLLQFVRGQAEKLTLSLFFDTTEDGMGAGAVSVTEKTDRIYELLKIEPDGHAPPVCEFCWNPSFPGVDTSASIGGAQRRSSFKCIVESVKQEFTLFSPEGVPLRAKLTVALREHKTLDEQLDQLNLNSPDRTRAHVVQRGETLSSIAARHYGRGSEWRRVAEANRIEDPRRIVVGSILVLPRIG